jgi:hypothetical protein
LPAFYIAGRDMSPTSPTFPGQPPIPTQQTTACLTIHCTDCNRDSAHWSQIPAGGLAASRYWVRTATEVSP